MLSTVELIIPANYNATVEALGNGSLDVAYLGGLTYAKAHARYGVVPLVQRDIDQRFHSLFITGPASSIKSLADLKGHSFCFGDINSLIKFLDTDPTQKIKAVMVIYERPPFSIIGRKSLGITEDPKSVEGHKLGAPQPANHMAAILIGAPTLGGKPVGNNRFYGANDPRRNTGLAAGY